MPGVKHDEKRRSRPTADKPSSSRRLPDDGVFGARRASRKPPPGHGSRRGFDDHEVKPLSAGVPALQSPRSRAARSAARTRIRSCSGAHRLSTTGAVAFSGDGSTSNSSIGYRLRERSNAPRRCHAFQTGASSTPFRRKRRGLSDVARRTIQLRHAPKTRSSTSTLAGGAQSVSLAPEQPEFAGYKITQGVAAISPSAVRAATLMTPANTPAAVARFVVQQPGRQQPR